MTVNRCDLLALLPMVDEVEEQTGATGEGAGRCGFYSNENVRTLQERGMRSLLNPIVTPLWRRRFENFRLVSVRTEEVNHLLIAVTVMLATFMELLHTAIANLSIPTSRRWLPAATRPEGC